MTTSHDPARKPLLIIQVLLVVALFVALTLAAIREASDSPSSPSATVMLTDTQPAFTPLGTATETSVSSTPTQPPTSTAIPTETPAPTPTPPREPITLTGQGDSVVYPQKWVGPALVRITYTGGGFFEVWTQDANGDRVEQLVQSIGTYHGDSLIDFAGNERTLRFEVRAGRDWQIDVLPLSSARHENLPGLFEGDGDAAIVLQGARPDLITIDASRASGDFFLYSYGRGRDLVLNATAPYTGTVSIAADATAIAIKCNGHWRIEISTR